MVPPAPSDSLASAAAAVAAGSEAEASVARVQVVAVAEPLPRSTRRKPGRRRMAVVSVVVVVAVLIGGATAWAVDSSGNSGYRLTNAVRASIGETVDLIGTIQPVNNADAAFQVAGQVTTVAATVGEVVTPGETLATLNPTSLTEAVSSAQSSLESDDAKLTQDRESEDTATSATPATSTTTTTTPAPERSVGSGSSPGSSPGSSSGSGSGSSSAIAADQQTLITDQQRASTDQQQEAADLAQAESVCGTTTSGSSGSSSSSGSNPAFTGPPPFTTTTTTTPTTPTTPTTSSSDSTVACLTDLQQASSDQQSVSNDQSVVATDETNLAKALTAAESADSQDNSTNDSSTGNTSSSGDTGNTGSSGDTGDTGAGNSATGDIGNQTASETAAESAAQIAADEAAIDQAEANLIAAQQSLSEATLTSPIGGTVASVGIGAGNTVTAGSSTDTIDIIGTKSYEAAGTLTSSQVASVKVGQTASVSIDGRSGSISGTVTQVGPVQSSESGYSYPVVVDLPTTVTGLFSGSTANVDITTGGVSGVVAVPTSAVNTVGTTAYVLTLSSGQLDRKVVKIGLIGDIYTQITSGLKVGDSVVLADLSEAVPSSNDATTGFGGAGFGGGGFGGAGFGGGGAGFVTRSVAPGAFG
jgi:HlyD family secretion protein